MHSSSSGVVVHLPGVMTDREVQKIAQAHLFFFFFHFFLEFTMSTDENLIQHAEYKDITTRKVLGGHTEFSSTHCLPPSDIRLVLFCYFSELVII